MLETLSELRAWITPGAVALVCYFLIRYITKRDQFETDMEKKFEEHTDQFAAKLQLHADTITKASDKFENAVLEVKNQAADMRKANIEFQMAITEKLAGLEVQTLGIKATLEDTAEKAKELESKVDNILDKVQFHDRAVTEFTRKFQENDDRLEKAESAIASRFRAKKH